MGKEISFKTSAEDHSLIERIADRAFPLIGRYNSMDRLSFIMDITAIHANTCKLNLQKLLDAEDFNFFHDVYGIVANINRETGELENCFDPRCSVPEK